MTDEILTSHLIETHDPERRPAPTQPAGDSPASICSVRLLREDAKRLGSKVRSDLPIKGCAAEVEPEFMK